MKLSSILQNKLESRKASNTLRKLETLDTNIDFSSNDYLGFSKSKFIFDKTHQYLIDNNVVSNGATGSRLITGNIELYNIVENAIKLFHNSEEGLIYNSGYDANIGLFSSILQKDDIILYDEFIHASIRDGIKLSNAQAFKFKHNSIESIEKRILQFKTAHQNIYLVTESVFSMDGDMPDLLKIAEICTENNIYLIVDEAHALGVFGKHGKGLVQKLNLEKNVFARIVTFGKALGCHGAAILCNNDLKEYLINFSRSFIYTTGLSPHALANILIAYQQLENTPLEQENLQKNINFFKAEISRRKLEKHFIINESAIQLAIISNIELLKKIATKLKQKSINAKVIMYPSVPKGKERLRICLHSFNTEEEISKIISQIATFVS